MTREERLRGRGHGRITSAWPATTRDLNYDRFVVEGEVRTQADEPYTSHNTHRLDVAGTVEKIKTAEYVRLALNENEAAEG